MTSAAKVEITEANLEALWIAFRLGVQEFVSNAPNDIVFQSENAYRKAAEKAGIAAIVETLVGAAERLP